MFSLVAKFLRSLGRRGVLKTFQMGAHYFAEGVPALAKINVRGCEFIVVAQDRIGKVVSNGQPWEEHLHALVQAALPKDANAIDVGANFGYHTVHMARHLSSGKVFAFEPLSLTFSQLQFNLIANKLENVLPYKLAVSDATGKYAEMDKIYFGRPELNIGNTSIGKGGDGTLTVRIDDLLLPKIAFIKIDIQGSELNALKGMEKLLLRDRPMLFVELEEHHLRKMGTSCKQVIEYLFQLKYVLLRVRNDYPCDHIAIPLEHEATLEPAIRRALTFELDRLYGRTIDLRFEKGGIYSGFTIIN